MLANDSSTIFVDGVSPVNVMYKRETSDVVKTQPYVIDEYGNPLGATTLTITDMPVGYMLKKIILHKNTIYNITGIAAPTDKMIFLSAGLHGHDIDALKKNIIATAWADKNGSFQFSNISHSDGVVSMWMTVAPKHATLASLTYRLTIIYDPDEGHVYTHDFSGANGEYAYPRYTITGQCSSNIEKVFLSQTDNTTDLSILKENTRVEVQPDSTGTFKIQYTGENKESGLSYVVWAMSKSDAIFSVASVLTDNDPSACLSGDTMITMADGSQQRMDTLSVGDIVLSEGGVSSRIYATHNGKFSSYHTLYHFEDGTVIDETHPHRFYNVDQGFWQRLQLWNIGDHAINQDGVMIALQSVEHLDESVEMFGIWTDSGTYYANGLLSGAASCNQKLLADVTAEQAVDMMLSADEEWLVQLMGLEAVLP